MPRLSPLYLDHFFSYAQAAAGWVGGAPSSPSHATGAAGDVGQGASSRGEAGPVLPTCPRCLGWGRGLARGGRASAVAASSRGAPLAAAASLPRSKAPGLALTAQEKRTIAFLLCLSTLQRLCVFSQQVGTRLITPCVRCFLQKHSREEEGDRQAWCVNGGLGQQIEHWCDVGRGGGWGFCLLVSALEINFC